MEENADEDMWEEPEESPDEDILEVDFDLKDPHDPVDDEMFPRDILIGHTDTQWSWR